MRRLQEEYKPEVTVPQLSDDRIRGLEVSELAGVVADHWEHLGIGAPPDAAEILREFAEEAGGSQRGEELRALRLAHEYALLCGSRTTLRSIERARELLGDPVEAPADDAEEPELDDHPTPIPDVLETGRAYSREDIHDLIGGSRIKFLPHVGGRVVAGAFRSQANPHAPKAVLVPGKESVAKWARVVCRQTAPIPVFLGVGGTEWVYKGPFRAAGLSDDPDVVRQYGGEPGQDDVAFVLFFEPA